MVPKKRSGKRALDVLAESSSFVVRALDECAFRHGLALDIPCGDGRHTRLLASASMHVISVDLDLPMLLSFTTHAPHDNRVLAICADATRGLPFADDLFDLVLVVHFPLLDVLPHLFRCVKPGGFLILESFGAQGGNWESLPFVGQIHQMLSSEFQLLRYAEVVVRRHPERVVLKAIARKH